MTQNIQVYNTLSRKKEKFVPINKSHVGMYVCGPTLYGPPHLGHARPSVVFDVIYRYLLHVGYKVRYVKNITDVGHLENDADAGEDKIAKKARVEQLEPMEVVQKYTLIYHENMAKLNVLPPTIEPRASGHIIEQINMVEEILKNGYAYVANGSVYFDVEKYNQDHPYGQLSGRKVEDLLSETRTLDGQEEKRNSADFALWKKASPEHIMRWPSPWSDGFPGWHIECSAMSTKYLGQEFDIHGGGMDLLFPHHECEIAQSVGSGGKAPVKYWLHNNMITINGKKMGKSLGNFINLDEFFSGNHKLLEQAYSAMTIRFFMLQAHYGGTLDFSNEGLKAAEKGLNRILDAHKVLITLKPNGEGVDIQPTKEACYKAMNDDFNTPIVLASIFDMVKIINSIHKNLQFINEKNLTLLKTTFETFVFEILGLKNSETKNTSTDISNEIMNVLIDLRKEAKRAKNFTLSDSIRDHLAKIGVTLKDSREGTSWEVKS